MKTSIFDTARQRVGAGLRAIAGTIAPEHGFDDSISVYGEWEIKVIRADGRVERKFRKNIVTRAGLNRLANRAVQATGTTPFHQIVVGTATAAATLDSAQGNIGEVIRKASAITGASAQSREWTFLQCTIGGFSDSLAGVALDSAAISDYPNSHASTGILANIVNGIGVTLANSDLLDLTVRIRVGSHNLSHST